MQTGIRLAVEIVSNSAPKSQRGTKLLHFDETRAKSLMTTGLTNVLHCSSMPMNLLKNKHLQARHVISAQNFPPSPWNAPAGPGPAAGGEIRALALRPCMNLHHKPPIALSRTHAAAR